MNRDVFGIRAYADETAVGQCVILAALVVALDEDGVLPTHRYCEALQRLWIEMPEEQVLGAGGEMIERVLDLVGATVGEDNRSDHEAPENAFSSGTGIAANDEVSARVGALPRLVRSP